MKKTLFTIGVLCFSFLMSFGQSVFTVKSSSDKIEDTQSLRYAVQNWKGDYEIEIDLPVGDNVILLTEYMPIFKGLIIRSKNGVIIKGDQGGYQQFLVGVQAEIEVEVVPTITFDGITFTGFGNTPLYIDDYYVDLNVSNCTFENNVMLPAKDDPILFQGSIDEGRAAAIGVGNNGNDPYSTGNIKVLNSTFKNNQGWGYGAMFLNGGDLQVTSSTFSNNISRYYKRPGGSEVEPPEVELGYGGAIYNNRGNITVDQSNFDGNSAFLSGGAVYSRGSNLEVTKSYFTTCTSPEGGAISVLNGSTVDIFNNTFTENGGGSIVSDKGGVFYAETELGRTQGAFIDFGFNTIVNNSISGTVNTNAAAVEIYNEMSVYLTANIIMQNNARDLYVNKQYQLEGGNFIEKITEGSVSPIENGTNYINASFQGPGLKSVAEEIEGRYVIPLKKCGALAMNVYRVSTQQELIVNVESAPEVQARYFYLPVDQLGNPRNVFGSSDAGAYEVQRIVDLSASVSDSILVTTDTTNVLSDLSLTNDCNVNIVKATFTLTNYDYEQGGLKILDTITYDSTLNYAYPKGTISISINKEVSAAYLEQLLKDKFVFIATDKTIIPYPILKYQFKDSEGSTVSGQKVITFPKYPQYYVISPNDVGVLDTIVLTGQNLDVTDKVKITPFREWEEQQQEWELSEAPPTTQDESVTVTNFIKQEEDTLSFVVPRLKAQQYSAELFNAYGTSYGGMGSTNTFSIELPKVDKFSLSKVRAGDTVFVAGDYLGGLDTISILDGTIRHYVTSTNGQIGSFNETNYSFTTGSDLDSAWFIFPTLAQATNVSAQVINPAGGSISKPTITVLPDTIESLNFVDASLDTYCAGDSVKLMYKPIGSFQSPNDSVVLSGKVGNLNKQIGVYHVSSPNGENFITFKVEEQFTELSLLPVNSTATATTLGITVNALPKIVISDLEDETCAKDSNGSFQISVTPVGVDYVTTVNANTITDLFMKDLIPDTYNVVSSFKGCKDSVSTVIKPGDINETLDFSINAPSKLCYGADADSANVFDVTSSTVDVLWSWVSGGIGQEEGSGITNILNNVPFASNGDSLLLVAEVKSTAGCYLPKSLVKTVKVLYVEEPYLYKVLSLTNEDVICDSLKPIDIAFTSSVNEPFKLYYSYGDIDGQTQGNLDSYSADVTAESFDVVINNETGANDTVFYLPFKHKTPVGSVNYDGITDSIEYKGCMFRADPFMRYGYSLSLKLIPSTDLGIDVIGESCFNGKNGSVKVIDNTAGHVVSWYRDTTYTNELSGEEQISSLDTGLYTVIIKESSNGYCPDTTSFTIKPFTGIKPSFDIVSEELCAGQEYQFKLENVTTTTIQSIDWRLGANTAISNSVNPKDTISPIVKITNQMYGDTLFVTMNVDECGSVKPYLDTLPLNINRNLASLSLKSNDATSITSCDGIDFETSYLLDSLITGSIMYKSKDSQGVITSNSVGVNDISFTISSVFATGAQTITIDSIKTGSCVFDVTDVTTQLVGYNKPIVSEVQSQDEKCLGDSNGVLIAKSIGTLHWLDNNDAVISKEDTVQNMAAGSYRVFATASVNGDCPSDTQTVVIGAGVIRDSVSFVLSGSDSICSNTNLELAVASSKGKGTFTWLFNGDTLQKNQDSSYVLNQLLQTSPNTYKVIMSNDAECAANAEYVISGNVTEYNVPAVALISGVKDPICYETSVFNVSNISTGDSIIWTLSNTTLDVDFHNGDSLSIDSLQNNVSLFAKLKSDKGCVGEVSDVFEVKPQGCDLKAEFTRLINASTGDIADTVCSSGVFIAKNTTIGDYTSVQWKINDSVVSTNLDSLKYDVSNIPSGTYDVEIVVENIAKKDSFTLVNAFTVIRDSVSFVLSGSDSICSNTNLELAVASSKGKGNFTWVFNNNTIKSNVDSTYKLNESLEASPNTYKVIMSNDAECAANAEYVISGNVTAYNVPATAIITGDTTPICYETSVFNVSNISTGDSIIWTLSNTTLDVDFHNGDSLSIDNLQNNVSLYAKLKSDKGCIGEVSDEFKVEPQGCNLKAEFTRLINASTGDITDTVCSSGVFIAKNTTIGDYTTVQWLINGSVVSTNPDSLIYDASASPSGTFNLAIIVENIAQKDTFSIDSAFTVIDTLPNQEINGDEYSCFSREQTYLFSNKDLPIKTSTWSVQNGVLRDTVYNGDSLATAFIPTNTSSSSILNLSVTSMCNEVKTYTKEIKNFSEDLSVILDEEECKTVVDLVLEPQLVKPNYVFEFKRKDGASGTVINDSTFQFNKDGQYSVSFLDTVSKCESVTKVNIGIIPGFSIANDTIFTKYSNSIEIKINIDNNDKQFIDPTNYVLDQIKYVNTDFAEVTLDKNAKILTYKSLKLTSNGLDSLYYFAKNIGCVDTVIIDSAKVYVFLEQSFHDTMQLTTTDKIELDVSLLLNNDFNLDMIIFDSDTTRSGKGKVDSAGFVEYLNGYDEETDIVSYLSCRRGANGDSISGTCQRSELMLRFPAKQNVENEVGDDDFAPEGKDFFDLKIYNVVTPDGDGIHDYFYISLLEKETQKVYPLTSNVRSTLQIFTKWGDMVYESEHYVFDDDSQFFRGKTTDGKELPNGTYYYVYDLAIDKDKTEDSKSFDLSKGFYTESGFLILKRP